MASGQHDAMDWVAFPCLPREMQRIIALECPAASRPRQCAYQAIECTADEADSRYRQHVATQLLAAELLEAQGAGDGVVSARPDRAPQWPQGFVGSITHTARFAAVAVMPQSMARSVGIDAERELAADQQELVRQYCLVGGELAALTGSSSLSQTQILTLCFSAKEAVFKCLYPLVNHHFDFTCVRIGGFNEALNLLSVQLLDRQIARCVGIQQLSGSFQLKEDHVFTAFRLPPC